MERLFCVDTGLLVLTWSAARTTRPTPRNVAGALVLKPLRRGLAFGKQTWRAGVAPEIAHDPTIEAGPILLEETDYEVYARSVARGAVSLHHQDPLVEQAMHSEEDGRVLHGLVNFKGQIGQSTFTLHVGGVPEVAFEVEVFPSKLDYVADHAQILAEVQEMATGLGLLYLGATRQRGAAVPAARATDLEWTLLLAGVVDDLERALRHIAEHPLRALVRGEGTLPAARITRPDASLRAAVRRGRGTGPAVHVPGVGPVRARLPASRPAPTLDTAEHRWLAAQLTAVLRRLSTIRRAVGEQRDGARRQRALHDLDRLEARVSALLRLEPMVAAGGEPPPRFASLRLLAAPGYREAYRACTTLARGLRVMEGPFALGVKDLSLLYEMYCFLATLRVLSRTPGVVLDLRDVFRVRSRGLSVHLARGRAARVRARAPGGRTLTVTYNPVLAHPHLPSPQRPDLLLTVEDRGWPRLHLVLDAKYRLDDGPDHVARYGAPGPPEDAINVLHRYRDAILEQHERPKRAVVQAAAAFPYRPPPGEDYAATRLYRSLAEIGVGAIPVLPGETALLERWLRAALLGGPWALSDTAVNHASGERAYDWRRAASELVLIGTLREENPAEHLGWVTTERAYYVPLARKQRRQFLARWIALYSPRPLRGDAGAVTHLAEVTSFEVKERHKIKTPWDYRRPPDEMMLLFHLRPPAELTRPVPNADGRRVPAHIWSSRLALDRAGDLGQLSMETEPEWRLYEKLTLRGIPFRIEAGPALVPDPEGPRGRARFQGEGWEARYVGGGFRFQREGSGEKSIVREEDVADAAAGV